eukprot:jgi/Botrbrau1/16749/Bobra.0277s0005.1
MMMVEHEFGEVVPTPGWEGVHVVYLTSRLDGLSKEFYKTKEKLEDTLDLYLSQRRRGRPIKKRRTVTVVGMRYGEWGTMRYGNAPRQVDALQFYSARLEELCSQIKEAQDDILPPNPESTLPAAFVTFSTRRGAGGGGQPQCCTRIGGFWHVDVAPEPREVLWKNLGYRRWERKLRQGLSWAAFFLIVAFYIPVVAAIQGLLQLDRLVSVPVVRDIVNLPLVHGIVEGLLPSLVTASLLGGTAVPAGRPGPVGGSPIPFCNTV